MGDVEVDECALNIDEPYDLGFHIGAIFIIMATSFIGTMIPVVGKRFPFFKLKDLPFSLIKMFGAGVILATGFIHMVLPATEALSNPCLPPVFEEYPFAGAAALFGVLFVHLVQFGVSKRIRGKSVQTPVGEVPVPPAAKAENLEDGIPMDDKSRGSTPRDSEPTINGHKMHHAHDHNHDHDHEHGHGLILSRESHESRIATYILEMGVASHSIIIGVALGVARAEFRSLLIALVFHQFFEGMALSSIVTESEKKLAALFMVCFYTLTTPIGIAIGIGINESFNENASGGLIAIGILDAVSGGILIYDGLVNVLGPHFASASFKALRTLYQLSQLTALWLGAFLMALIGAWA
eukprot:TRINITY_DN4136_c0_g1_i1.p1 TRINITY_DN4136_c0_g1~~TRINITY_DN4136_c0_g1_i1.p1  ORF type:complete len:372 (+),score=89.23 TRINITY_DN4136_c0_g1_i1:63-1118(+)